MAAKSNAPQYVDISFTKRHDIALIKATQGKSGRARSYICATGRIERMEAPISYKSRTLRCCVQCSVVAKASDCRTSKRSVFTFIVSKYIYINILLESPLILEKLDCTLCALCALFDLFCLR